MCDICVINSVKQRMLSRRDFFQQGAAAAASVAAGAAVVSAGFVAPSAAAKTGDVADLTHVLHEEFPTFGGEQQFSRKSIYNYAEHKFNLLELRMNEHTGTHIDAPLHFSENGMSVDEIPPANLVAPLCVIDIKKKAAASDEAQVTPDDIKQWTSVHGDIPAGACVAMNSGWDKRVNSAKFRNADEEGKLHFPGFHIETAMLLLEQDVAGIAVDTLSIDYGMSADFAVHYEWLPQGRWGLECIANLDALPAKGATIIVGAPKHKGGTGGPSRVLALV